MRSGDGLPAVKIRDRQVTVQSSGTSTGSHGAGALVVEPVPRGIRNLEVRVAGTLDRLASNAATIPIK